MKTFFRDHILMYVLSAVLVSMLFIVSGCCTQRRAVESSTTITEKDTSKVDVRVEKVIEYQIDTVFVEVPAQMAERTTQDSISHLENDYATSDARINSDGSLFHNLNTKPQKKPIEYQKPIERKDSIRTEYKYIEVEKEKKIPVEVERDFTWWEATSIKWFPWSLVLIVISIGIHFRKPLWRLIKRVFCNS